MARCRGTKNNGGVINENKNRRAVSSGGRRRGAWHQWRHGRDRHMKINNGTSFAHAACLCPAYGSAFRTVGSWYGTSDGSCCARTRFAQARCARASACARFTARHAHASCRMVLPHLLHATHHASARCRISFYALRFCVTRHARATRSSAPGWDAAPYCDMPRTSGR